ncbi:protein phosphatase 2C domain-containing protein [Streptomyces gardneri]|uniref:PP2C family serine/threonine-protein phosphatase n=1 Tax=Streptomyces gardneri TaxID=66892 RepID=UPI000716BE2A|nr:PP2C family serine/threonine-protein phosphatase [Streptomyces gardneri]QPK50507.1 protein phosphatase 2C domain-containing protein [Streptomyces gardneri]WRK41982.1 PP2C family serine/threonine-protein phosphatase [Streptomyces venezuelae]
MPKPNPEPKLSHGLAACPGCAEPLDSGDRFCGACGHDLSAVASAEPDRPTVAIGTPVVWPAAPPREPGSLSTATQHPGDLPGTDSGGRDLPTMAVRTDGPVSAPAPAPQAASPSGGDFELAAPDPRTAVQVDPPQAQPQPPVPAQPPAPAQPPVPAQPPAAASGAPASGAVPLCVACRAGRVDTDGYCENCGHAQPRERDHMERELDTVAAVSDRGLRHHRNEDSFAVSATTLPDGSRAALAIVCDGVSSATRPDEASAAAAQAAGASLLAALPRGIHPQQAMHEAIVAASEAVNSLAEEPGQDGAEHDPHRNSPACTIVGSVVADGLLVVGWVGDSRVYWVPDDRSAPSARLTEDDSWAAQMVAAGLMNEAEAYADERAHAITGWLGADAYELDPHTAAFKPDRSGVVVVCTDGLWNYAEGAEDMARVVPPDAAGRPLHGAQVLVGHALDGGGHDNITVALLPFTVSPPGAGSA